MSDLFMIAADLAWQSIPDQACQLVQRSLDPAKTAQERLCCLPGEKLAGVFYSPDIKQFMILSSDVELRQKAAVMLRGVAEPDLSFPVENAQWVPVLLRSEKQATGEKQATSAIARGLGQAATIFPSSFSKYIPFAGSPLVSTLAGGMLGAGAGYGAGWLGETLMPSSWKKGRLRKTLAILGGLVGAAPGAFLGAQHLHEGRSLLEPSDLHGPPTPNDPNYQPPFRYQSEKETEAAVKAGEDGGGEGGEGGEGGDYGSADDFYGSDPTGAIDFSRMQQPWHGAGNDPIIHIDTFNQTVWNDPSVANRLQPAQQAALSGLVTGAAYQDGRKMRWITPADVGRMTMGMGSGYFSGALVGKALGVLTGMPEETQDKLKRTGMYAGILANLVPIAFGL